jgi:hypothetical protein
MLHSPLVHPHPFSMYRACLGHHEMMGELLYPSQPVTALLQHLGDSFSETQTTLVYLWLNTRPGSAPDCHAP